MIGQDRVQHADRGRAGAQQLGRRLRLGRPAPAEPRAAGRHRRRRDRYKQQNTISTFYFFLNTQAKPFNNQLAREAVNYALDRRAINAPQRRQLHADVLVPARRAWSGIRPAPARTAIPTGRPDLAKAKALVKQSGMEGQPVTVSSETRSPRKEFVSYYTDVLNQIGFKAKSKIIADAQYFATIGNSKSEPQTGFADWNQDFPNPSDFYLLMDADSIQATNNENFSQVDDPHIQSELKVLNAVPADKLDTVADRWQKLDEYLARKAYIAAYGAGEAADVLLEPDRLRRRRLQSAVRERLVVDLRSSRWPRTEAIGTEFSSGADARGGRRPPGSGPYALAWRRLRRNHVALFFGGLFILIVVLCLLRAVSTLSTSPTRLRSRTSHRDLVKGPRQVNVDIV